MDFGEGDDMFSLISAARWISPDIRNNKNKHIDYYISQASLISLL